MNMWWIVLSLFLFLLLYLEHVLIFKYFFSRQIFLFYVASCCHFPVQYHFLSFENVNDSIFLSSEKSVSFGIFLIICFALHHSFERFSFKYMENLDCLLIFKILITEKLLGNSVFAPMVSIVEWFNQLFLQFSSVQFSSVTQSCPTLCDPLDCSSPGFPVQHQLLELTQTHVHWVGDAISSSVVPFSSCLQSFPASGSFQIS